MDERALLAAVNDSSMTALPLLVLADWYQDQGREIESRQCRICAESPIPVSYFRFARNGDGYGNGYGYGDGYGDGNGYGYGDGNGYGYGDGYGNGYGNGNGDGDGYGYGYGDGNGYGNGDGDGYGDGLFPRLKGGKGMPEVGKNQLIVLAHGWVICGFVAEQPGPFQFIVENAVVICRTGGVPWDELADGKRRAEATYRKWGRVTIGPQFVLSREWKGKLP